MAMPTISPTAFKIISACLCCSCVTKALACNAVIPQPINAGILGMVRTIAISVSPNQCVIFSERIPAAIEINNGF